MTLAICELLPWKDIYDEMYERRMKHWYILRKGKAWLWCTFLTARRRLSCANTFARAIRSCLSGLTRWNSSAVRRCMTSIRRRAAAAMHERKIEKSPSSAFFAGGGDFVLSDGRFGLIACFAGGGNGGFAILARFWLC